MSVDGLGKTERGRIMREERHATSVAVAGGWIDDENVDF